MADDNGSDTVSREAHDRVKAQLEAAQKSLADKDALNTQANKALHDLSLRLKAAEALEAADIPGAVKRSVYTVPHLGDVDGDEAFTARMETIIGDLGWTPTTNGETPGGEPPEPQNEATPPPAIAAPNPASPGAPPAAKQAVDFATWYQQNPGKTTADFVAAVQAGDVAVRPDNPEGQQLLTALGKK